MIILSIVRKNEENTNRVLGERSARLRDKHFEIEKHVKDFKQERDRLLEERSEQISLNLIKVEQKIVINMSIQCLILEKNASRVR
jgi:adenylate kinase family enzyme